MNESTAKPNPAPDLPAAPPAAPGHENVPEEMRPASRLFKITQAGGILLIVGGVLVVFVGFVLGVPIPGMHPPGEEKKKPPSSLGVRLVEWFRLTDDSLTSLRDSVRKAKESPSVQAKLDAVLTKLAALKDKTLEREPFLAALEKRLAEDERERFQDLLLKHSAVPSHTLAVPVAVRETLGIRKRGKDQVEILSAPTETRPLVLYGSTALDPTRLMRIRARFAPAEVVSVGKVHELGPEGRTVFRELRPGDRVKKGEVLGIFFSVDVGSKKNDLLDALVQLRLDQEILDRWENSRGSIPDTLYLTQVRVVQGDRNNVNRALNNLKVWNIPQDEIDALHEEAKKISADKNAWFKTPAGRWFKGEKGKVDPDKEKENPWGKVTLRAPFDGIIVERNVVPGEMVVDNTVNLFQIAQVHRLLVIANAPEDELPNLNALTFPERKWTVKTVGAKASTELPGPIEEIGYLIDPNQHTAVIKGYISNPGEHIRAGQFVSATVRIQPPKDVVEVPLDAVVEDGQYSVVFVQPDPAKQHYTMRRVQLMHRFEKVAFVRATPFTERERLTPQDKEQGLQPLEPLRPGERILKTGVGELKAALLDLESQPAGK
jgi:cobalt-zinc-cadmium efflux system membrane fusion protein